MSSIDRPAVGRIRLVAPLAFFVPCAVVKISWNEHLNERAATENCKKGTWRVLHAGPLHVSKDIKSTGEDMRRDDIARSRRKRSEARTRDVVHDAPRTRHRSSSISHAFGFSQRKIPLRFFQSSGRCIANDARAIRLRFV